MINRCVCYEVTFAELRDLAAERRLRTVEELRCAQDFAGNCRMCVPYVKKMLRTRETAFSVTDPGDPDHS